MAIPIHDLWWLAAGGSATAGARFMKVRIDAALTARRRSRLPDPTGELLRLQSLYGYNPHSLVSIAPGALTWSTPDIDGAIIYGEFSRVWLAAGDPLAPLEDMAELARQFGVFAKQKNRMVAFVPTSSEFAHAVAPRDFVAVKCGASPASSSGVSQPARCPGARRGIWKTFCASPTPRTELQLCWYSKRWRN